MQFRKQFRIQSKKRTYRFGYRRFLVPSIPLFASLANSVPEKKEKDPFIFFQHLHETSLGDNVLKFS